jgi:hypothetical protein
VEGFGRHRQARLLRSGSVNGKKQVFAQAYALFVRISLIPPKAVLVFKVIFSGILPETLSRFYDNRTLKEYGNI